MSEDQVSSDVNYEEQYRSLLEENKKMSIDIASLQLSNRSLVNQNRDEKKKVMDCRLQISDLESRINTLASIKSELSECQTQSERLRASLDATESKLASTEKRAIEAEGLIRVKDSIIEKQRNFSKEMELQVKGITDENENLKCKCGNLEMKLNEALDRAEECDRLRDIVAAKTELLDKLAEASDGVNEVGLAAANAYFKTQETKMNEQLSELKQSRAELEIRFTSLTCENDALKGKLDKQESEIATLKEKCTTLETRVKESGHSDRRSRSDAANARLIGPSLPPWKLEEKKTDPCELEKLANADPATLRSRVLELEGQVHELNQLLTYREDVILRIHEEISKKASRLEAAEVERSSLSAQVSILKRELACLRDDAPRRRGGYPPEVEIELVRLRGKRDREYQRRKRAETEMDELDQENTELKAKIKTLEENIASMPPPKPPAPVCDPADKSRIAELQAAASQLRMDNEAKRSELFDLRSRFDERSGQLDKLTSELKTKERALSELSQELSTKVGQLEYANKELEAVRCRVVRGGSETERWQTDLNSVRTTNRFLSSQTNELRMKLASTERQLVKLQDSLALVNKSNPCDDEYVLTGRDIKQSSNDEQLCNGISLAFDEQNRIEEIEAELENQIMQCKSLENKLSEASVKESELIDQMDLHKNKFEEKNAEFKALSSQFSDLKNIRDHLEKQVITLSEELRVKSQDCKRLENILEEKSSRLESQEEEIMHLKESMHTLTRRSSDLQDELNLISSSEEKQNVALLKEKDELISSLNSRIIAMEIQFEEAINSIGKLRLVESEFDSLKLKFNDLELDLENARKTIDDHLKEKSLIDNNQVSDAINQNEHLLLEIKENQKSIIDSHQRCSSLTAKVGDLESELETLRTKLNATAADNRRTDIEKISQASLSLSPPAKRSRRTRSSNATSTQPASDCVLCTELKSQIESLESDLSEANNCRSTCTTDLIEVRRQLAKADEDICELNRQISSLLDKIKEANDKLEIHYRQLYHFLTDVDSRKIVCSGDTSALENLRKLAVSS